LLRDVTAPAIGENYQADINIDLPLLLTNSGGQIGRTRALTSPYGSRLSRGDLENADLSQYTTRTQSDFIEGAGQHRADGQTRGYANGPIDTRFQGKAITPLHVTLCSIPSGVNSDPIAGPATPFAYFVRGTQLLGASLTFPGTPVVSLVTTLPVAATDVAYYNGLYYIAYGAARDVDTWNGATLTTIATRVTKWCVDAGYLHGLHQGKVRYFDGAVWVPALASGGIPIHPSGETANAIAGWREQIWVATDRGLYSMAGDIGYPVYKWSAYVVNGVAGRGMSPAFDGGLYIPLGETLLRFDGTQFQSSNPPSIPTYGASQPTVHAIISSPEYLYVLATESIPNTNQYRGTLYARDRNANWHNLARFESGGATPPTVGPVYMWQGLLFWWANGKPYQFRPYLHAHEPLTLVSTTAELESSTQGLELSSIYKDLHSISVTLGPPFFSAGATLYVDMQYNDNGTWLQVGTLTGGRPNRRFDFNFAVPALTAKFFVSYDESTPNVYRVTLLGSTADIVTGSWIRIGRIAYQVDTIIDATHLTLREPIRATHLPGEDITGSRPVVRAWRWRLRIVSTVSTPVTVESVTIKYQDVMLDRYRWTLHIRCEDELIDRQGGKFPYGIALLQWKLDAYMRRGTPFQLVDIDGSAYTVKVANANESMARAVRDEQSGISDPSSVWTLTLIEA